MSNRKAEIPTTKRGCDIYEVASALQKCIRRGDEQQAVYWAAELETINPKMAWNRLRVISSEDIGPANSTAALLIDTLERNYFDSVRRENGSSRLFLAHAVLFLARSPKSRIVDNLLTIVYNTEEKLEIPDYALDMHTYRGRKMGRGLEHFFAEGAKLANQAFEDPYEKTAFETLMKKKKT